MSQFQSWEFAALQEKKDRGKGGEIKGGFGGDFVWYSKHSIFKDLDSKQPRFVEPGASFSRQNRESQRLVHAQCSKAATASNYKYLKVD